MQENVCVLSIFLQEQEEYAIPEQQEHLEGNTYKGINCWLLRELCKPMPRMSSKEFTATSDNIEQ